MSTVPSTSTSAYGTVKYNDGEALEHLDLVSQQQRSKSSMLDLVVPGSDFEGNSMGVASSFGNLPNYCYCPRMGQAYPEPGTGLEVIITPGWLGQRDTSFSAGTIPRILMAPIPSSSFTFDAADASLPRVDLIQMRLTEVDSDNQSRDFKDAITGALSSQLMDKQTGVQIEWGIKNGTPAASPVSPAPDSGWVGVVRHLIPALEAQAERENLIDIRMPMRVTNHRISKGSWWSEDVSDWTLNGDGGVIRKAVAGADAVYAPAPVLYGRIIGVWIVVEVHADGNERVELVRRDLDFGETLVLDLYTLLGITSTSPQEYYAPTLYDDDSLRPIWANYYGAPQGPWGDGWPQGVSFSAPVQQMVMHLAVNGGISSTEILDAGFVIAGDL